MEQKAARAAVAKAFKARGVKQRKGHWRLPHDELSWWIDLRADSPRPDAALSFEIGAWVPECAAELGLGKEPEGGAVDCPLLLDRPLETGGDVAAQVDGLVDLLERLDTTAAIATEWPDGALAGALVDDVLRTRLA